MEHFAAEVSKEKWIGGLTGGDLIVAPGTAPTLGLAPTPEVVALAEPDAALRLTVDCVVIPVGRSLVAAEGEQAAEATVVRNRAQVLTDWLYAPDMVFECDRLQLVEHALDIHHEVFGLYLADTHPLRLPGLFEGVRGFGKPIALPLSFDKRGEQDRFFVPAVGEHDVAHVLTRGDVHVRLVGDAAPRRSSVPLEEACLRVSIMEEAIIRDDDSALRGVAAFKMRLLIDAHVFGEVEEQPWLEVAHVHLVEQAFHRLKVDPILGIGEVRHGRGEPLVNEAFDLSPFAGGVDDVGADDALIGVMVDEAIGVDAIVDVDECLRCDRVRGRYRFAFLRNCRYWCRARRPRA